MDQVNRQQAPSIWSLNFPGLCYSFLFENKTPAITWIRTEEILKEDELNDIPSYKTEFDFTVKGTGKERHDMIAATSGSILEKETAAKKLLLGAKQTYICRALRIQCNHTPWCLLNIWLLQNY